MRTRSESTISEILDFINDKFFTEKSVPTLQEIADNVGITKGAVSKYLTTMEERGLVEKNGSHYGITTIKMKKAMKNTQYLPIVGEVACGTPILAEQNIESYLTISGDFLGAGDYFVLKAKGNSMINAGIDNGDYVIIRQQQAAEEGQIVLALVDDGEATLKRYYRDRRKRKIRLHPENEEMEDMYFSNIQIQGVAIKVIKSLEN